MSEKADKGAPEGRVPLTEIQLLALEGALARASPAPWEAVLRDHPRGQPSCFYRGIVALVQCDVKSLAVVLGNANPHETVPEERWEANAAAIAGLRNLAPALIEEIRAARAWRKEAEALLHKTVMADHCHGHICRKHDRCQASRVEEEVWNFLGDREGNAP